MPSIENFLTYAFWQYGTIGHLSDFSTIRFLAWLARFALASKPVFGVIPSQVALRRSAHIGLEPAQAA
ncbi:hypothetical protein Ga0102493_11364 [Erythrobacter litoralis]|uniref:Uncharacterized protein n=1 Tax=Erythrobacter litoralis TaxID=39960 RepID=A0A074MKD4_9SPHN|nr:hypothetical protein [Erythrobacter litoralis]AOL24505.1 hypothetical protein Ga0102493_11364 [Erythrobacter litoralis]KEO93255.1 hypothetical protein EH32_11055 [Erythrobacter litoralis]